MTIVQFIRLLWDNVKLIVAVGFIMAFLVFFMTRGETRTYRSSTTIYTGLATGYSIENTDAKLDLFGTNAKFDNLRNIVQLRETQEETAVRLLAQHLSLQGPNSKYLSRANYQKLNSDIPYEIKDIVNKARLDFDSGEYVKRYVQENEPTKTNAGRSVVKDSVKIEYRKETVLEKREVPRQIEKTRLIPKTHRVKSGESLFSIAKLYNVGVQEIRRLNKLTNASIHGGQLLDVGQVEETYLVDTLMIEEVEVEKEVPVEVPVYTDELDSDIDLTGYSDYEADRINDQIPKTLSGLIADELFKYKEASDTNYIYRLLQSSHPHYGVKNIRSIRPSRIQSSDLIQMSYSTDDPGVCQQTLVIITDVFTRKFNSLKIQQTGNVTDYYYKKTRESRRILDSLEQELKNYKLEYDIINYNEQTKFIADQFEKMGAGYYDELGKKSAAEAAVRFFSEQLKDQGVALEKNQKVSRIQDELGEVSREILTEELKAESPERLGQLRRQRTSLENDLENAVRELYAAGSSASGVKYDEILNNWVQKSIELVESRSRFEVFKERQTNFMEKFSTFAPHGSTIKRLEREINMAEEEYIDNNQSLNYNMQRETNAKMSNSIKVMDDPLYPLDPQPSKRKFIILAALLAGMLITAGVIIFLEFIDSSIKTPERALDIVDKPLIGAFPLLPGKEDRSIDFPLVTHRSIDLITQKIRLDAIKKEQAEPYIITSVSTRRHEGKSLITGKIASKLRQANNKVLFIKPLDDPENPDFVESDHHIESDSESFDFEYEVSLNFMEIRNVNELLRNYTFITKGYDYIFIELPALLQNDFPTSIVQNADMALLFVRANRSWNKADTESVEVLGKTLGGDVQCVLNGVRVDFLESIIGEIPRKRSYIRKLIKKVILFDFKSIASL